MKGIRNKLVRTVGVLACSLALVGAGSLMATAASAGSGANPPKLGPAGGGLLKNVKLKSQATINVGGGITVHYKGPLHVAFFENALSNAYSPVRLEGIKQEIAQIPGATLTQFNANSVCTAQYAQIASAIASKKYNAFILDPCNGSTICKEVSQTAPRAGILVVSFASQVCNLQNQPTAQKQLAAGDVAFVSNMTLAEAVDYFTYIATQTTAPQKVIVLTGPAAFTTSSVWIKGYEEVEAKYPNFKVVDTEPTDFTELVGEQEAQTALLANPDATTLMTAYSDITQGALIAIQKAGLTGKIKVYDVFSSAPIIQDIKKGTVTASVGGFPLFVGHDAVKALVYAINDGQRTYWGGDGGPVTPGPFASGGFTIITKANISQFPPQY
jgi:ribose transport system substrate-binding protein